MPNTVYKINDQDPLFNTRTLTPHPNITYMETNKQTNKTSVCINRSETNCGGIINTHTHPQDCNSPINFSSNDKIKTEKAKKGNDDCFPQDIVT